MNHHWVQLAYQLADSAAGAGYSFVGTCVILAVLDFIGRFLPVFRLRANEDEELLGIDDVEIGEFAVSSFSLCCSCSLLTSFLQYDYVELAREVKSADDDESGLSMEPRDSGERHEKFHSGDSEGMMHHHHNHNHNHHAL